VLTGPRARVRVRAHDLPDK